MNILGTRPLFCVCVVLFAVLTRVFYLGVLDVSSSDLSDSYVDHYNEQAGNKPDVVSFSRVYRDVNVNANASVDSLNHVALSMRWGNESSYTLGHKIGQGRHSTVFIGTETSTGAQYAIKALKPTALTKVAREVVVMKALAGCPNVVHMHDAFRDTKGRHFIVQELAKGEPLKKLASTLSANETALVAHKLLKALECAHSHGIMHRDVKPQNVIYNRETGALTLIDWGLAEFYVPGRRYNVSVASTSYKPPELLVKMRYYDYSLELWSFGCELAEALLKEKHPLFKGNTRCKTLKSIMRVLGSKNVLEYITKYNLKIPCKNLPSVLEPTPLCSSKMIKSPHTEAVCRDLDTKGLDLLKGLLTVDHSKRPTASEALRHPYFTKQ